MTQPAPPPQPPPVPPPPGAASGAARPAAGHAGSSALLKLVWPAAALALLLLIGALFVPGFLTVSFENGQFAGYPVTIVTNSTQVMLLALGMCLVIATGGIDLSVGTVMAISAATAGVLSEQGWPAWQIIPIALGAALLAGAWNGVLVALLDIQPIIATLVLLVAGRGIAQLITGGQVPAYPAGPTGDALVYIAQGVIFGIPFPLILALGMFLLTVLLVRQTAVGLMIETIGENPTTARYVGIPVVNIKLLVYTFSGLCAGLAGLVAAGFVRRANANVTGLYFELDAIFAVVVGGTALIGGRFYLIGALLGAILLQALTDTITAMDVRSDLLTLPKAIVIIVVILLQAPVFRRRVVKLAGSLRGRNGPESAARGFPV